VKFLCISDLHLCGDTPVGRRDDIVATWKGKITYVLKYAKEHNLSILAGGDVYDTPRNWHVLTDAMDILQQYKVPIYSVWGQHDTYLYSQESRRSTALGVLDVAGLVTTVGTHERPTVHLSNENITIYGASYGQGVPVPKYADETNILLVHDMVVDTPLWYGQQSVTSNHVYLKKHSGYKLIVVGDAHQRFIFSIGDRLILNSGPMLRLEASEEMLVHKPGFWVWDSATCKAEWQEIPHQSADQVLSRVHIEAKADRNERAEAFISAMKSGGEGMTVDYFENLLQFMRENDIPSVVRECIAQRVGREI